MGVDGWAMMMDETNKNNADRWNTIWLEVETSHTWK
jgi:hypothetical protein